MFAVNNLVQRICCIPEHVRTPRISNKELEQMLRNMLMINEFKHNVYDKIGIR